MDAIISAIEKTPEYWRYHAQARNAPKATDDARVALVSQQLGLSDADLRGRSRRCRGDRDGGDCIDERPPGWRRACGWRAKHAGSLGHWILVLYGSG
jgi:hypothetical protein